MPINLTNDNAVNGEPEFVDERATITAYMKALMALWRDQSAEAWAGVSSYFPLSSCRSQHV